MGPNLGQVKGVEVVVQGVRLRHDLHADTPCGEVAPLDGIKEVASIKDYDPDPMNGQTYKTEFWFDV